MKNLILRGILEIVIVIACILILVFSWVFYNLYITVSQDHSVLAQIVQLINQSQQSQQQGQIKAPPTK